MSRRHGLLAGKSGQPAMAAALWGAGGALDRGFDGGCVVVRFVGLGRVRLGVAGGEEELLVAAGGEEDGAGLVARVPCPLVVQAVRVARMISIGRVIRRGIDTSWPTAADGYAAVGDPAMLLPDRALTASM